GVRPCSSTPSPLGPGGPQPGARAPAGPTALPPAHAAFWHQPAARRPAAAPPAWPGASPPAVRQGHPPGGWATRQPSGGPRLVARSPAGWATPGPEARVAGGPAAPPSGAALPHSGGPPQPPGAAAPVTEGPPGRPAWRAAPAACPPPLGPPRRAAAAGHCARAAP